jgi:hypothetical protein
MNREWEVGDRACLINLEKGYRHVEIRGFDGLKLIVQTESGWEFSVYPDELENA